MNKCKEVEALRACITEHQLEFEVLTAQAPLSDIFWREIIIQNSSMRIRMPVEDQHHDAERGPVAQLHLILATCECFEEESVSLAQWCREAEVPNNEHGAALFAQLAQLVPQLRTMIGHQYQAISLYDMEFNTNIAQAMRNA